MFSTPEGTLLVNKGHALQQLIYLFIFLLLLSFTVTLNEQPQLIYYADFQSGKKAVAGLLKKATRRPSAVLTPAPALCQGNIYIYMLENCPVDL